jgi:hypothetical protein
MQDNALKEISTDARDAAVPWMVNETPNKSLTEPWPDPVSKSLPAPGRPNAASHNVYVCSINHSDAHWFRRLFIDANGRHDCSWQPRASGLVPVVFHKHVLDEHQMGFAAGELVAHVNYMLVEGRLTSEVADGVLRFRTT